MILLRRPIALTVFLICACTVDGAVEKGTKLFNSSTGFSVTYPAAWYRIGLASQDRLNILSSESGAEGIVIKHCQAEIIVMESLGPAGATLTQLIEENNRGEVSILSRREIHRQTAEVGGCRDLKEIISEQEAVPSEDVPVRVAHIINTDYYCEVDGRKLSTLLKNWQGDNRQKNYQSVALEVAESLHLTHD
jgi:hypothetical protein